MAHSLRRLALGIVMLMSVEFAKADEGMWLFNHPPRELLVKNHQFDATDAWLAHLMHSAIRLSSGGSGSFVSPDGLLLTNHHVGASALQQMSTPGHDLLSSGYYARRHEDELKCPDMELNVLINITDVTDRVNAAVKPDMPGPAALLARRAVMNTLEEESLKETGLRSDVVTLFQGGQYQLYRYKRYTDVRLVFAPEKAIAFFGGDPDNFEFPRHDLDVTFFRAYENGAPAHIEHYLKWSAAGARENELIFVAGHPGHTDRLNTVAHLEFLRDVALPDSLGRLRRREVLLRTFSEAGSENARRAQSELFSIENGRKAYLGRLAGLQDPAIFSAKGQEEARTRQIVGSTNPDPWARVEAAMKVSRAVHEDMTLLEGEGGFNSNLFSIARTLVRLADESAKPNAKRLREYRESNLPSLELELFSEAPIYSDLETLKLADSLSFLVERRGGDDPLVKQVLAGKAPTERAAELISATKLADVAVRKKLADGGQPAITASDDPMIRLALLIDPPARKVREVAEQQIEEPLRQAYAQIAQALFKAAGASVYPDATFTLRLAFGQVRGYQEQGRQVPAFTTLGDAFRHADEHHNLEPFRLPESWMRQKSRLNLDVALNFVSTADIIGGNSGSPVVNREGELVGLIFDGNIHSLVLDFAYTSDRARAVAVNSAAIVEALRKLYDAGPLADELQGKAPAPAAAPAAAP